MTADDLARYAGPELLAQLGEAVTVIGPDWRYLWVSPRAAEIIGRPVDECVGAHVWDLFPEAVGTAAHEACVRAMTQRTRETLVWWFDTVGRWYEQHALPVADGLVVYVHDVSDRHDEARRGEQLAAVGEAVAGAATVEEVNAALVEHLHPHIGAAAGTIVLADDEREVMRALGWAGTDAQTVADWTEFPMTADVPSTHAHRSGEPVVVRGLDDVRARFPAILPDLERLGRDTVTAFPLVSAGVRLGAWSVVFTGGQALDDAGLRFLSTAAAMVAQALLRARLLEAERRGMAQLQRSLLPRTVVDVPGLDVAVRYAAGDAAVEVGGDWYDVVPLAEGAVGLVMGDVEGHDVEAAACMGLVRSAVRAYAAEGHPPAVVLALADRFVAETDLGRLVTVAYAHVHPLERLVTTVSAGHLPLTAVMPSGETEDVPTETGPPLGVPGSGPRWPETTSTLVPHALLAAFTDGLVETRREDLTDGLARVKEVLVASRALPLEEIAERVLAARSTASRDDVALLVARLTSDAPEQQRSTRRLPATSASVALARRSTRQLLAAWEVPRDVAERAELVVSELVTNAARSSEDALDLAVSVVDGVLRLEVADTSHRLPVAPPEDEEPDLEATSGRGLVLVAAVTDRWGVQSEGLAKRVWAEIDLPR